MVVQFSIDLGVQGELARYRLPTGVQNRLQGLLDRQDEGISLTDSERAEAEGLVELAELLTLMKLRAENVECTRHKTQ